MKVELIDLKQRYLDEKDELLKCVEKVLQQRSFVLTEEVSNFENLGNFNIYKLSLLTKAYAW